MNGLEFMWRGGNVKRYHTERTLMEDTVGHHSYNVACIIMHLRPGASAALLRAALKHDMAEWKMGDMPAPAKRAMPDFIELDSGGPPYKARTFREVFAIREAELLELSGIATENLSDEEAWVLKLADSMDGMRFCIQERRMGNVGVTPIWENFRAYVAELLFGPDKTSHLSQYEENLLEPARFCDYTLFKYMVGEWYDLCK